jgi:beta-lactam-binding protein with PASTA domain
VRSRAVLKQDDPAVKNKWVTLVDEAEQDLEPNATVRVPVNITFPSGVDPGKYTFRLDMVNAQIPDEGDSGPTCGLELLPAVSPGFPKWMIPVLAVVVLVIGGTVAWLLLSRSAKMPDVSGKDIGEATAALNTLHVSVTTLPKIVPAPQENKVLEQNVAAGAKIVPDKTAVILTVGAVTKMPDVTGKDIGEATIALTALHVKVETKTKPVPAEQANKVLEQSVAQGANIVADQTTVILTVGDARQKVPVIVGHVWVGDAQSLLAAAQFGNIKVAVRPAANVAPGVVSEQHPDPGTDIAATDLIEVVVAATPQPQSVKVPPLQGIPFEMAAAKLMTYGLVLGETTGNLVPGAIVQSSNPPAGAPVSVGSPIALALPAPPGCVGPRCFIRVSDVVKFSILQKSPGFRLAIKR